MDGSAGLVPSGGQNQRIQPSFHWDRSSRSQLYHKRNSGLVSSYINKNWLFENAKLMISIWLLVWAFSMQFSLLFMLLSLFELWYC